MKFIKRHFGFILTITVTYLLGIILTIAQYIAIDATMIIELNPSLNPNLNLYSSTTPLTNIIIENDKNFLKILLDSLIPTTITYVLGCVLVNISELLKEKADEYVFNVFTCIFVMFYAVLFGIYVHVEFSILWVAIEIAATILLIILNILCYKEKFKYKIKSLV